MKISRTLTKGRAQLLAVLLLVCLILGIGGATPAHAANGVPVGNSIYADCLMYTADGTECGGCGVYLSGTLENVGGNYKGVLSFSPTMLQDYYEDITIPLRFEFIDLPDGFTVLPQADDFTAQLQYNALQFPDKITLNVKVYQREKQPEGTVTVTFVSEGETISTLWVVPGTILVEGGQTHE